jgi:5,10-methenyltetrahydromethanopterin hydrogenase
MTDAAIEIRGNVIDVTQMKGHSVIVVDTDVVSLGTKSGSVEAVKAVEASSSFDPFACLEGYIPEAHESGDEDVIVPEFATKTKAKAKPKPKPKRNRVAKVVPAPSSAPAFNDIEVEEI